MAKQATLQAEKREVKGTTASKRLRREGIVPGVIYGSSQREYMIQLDAKSFLDVARKQSSQNFIVNLEIAGADSPKKLAIVQDIQRDSITGQVVHVDFRAVSEKDTIHAVIPIALVGESKGVKNGGILEQLIHEIEVHCKPSDLPDRIENEVSALALGDSLKVGQLNLPDGVTTTMNPDVLVCLVTKTRASVSAGVGGEEAAEGEGGEEAAAEGGESEGGEEAAAE